MSTTRMLRVVIGTVTFTVPVTLTVLDVVGYIAKVEGISMQPSLNPDGQRSCDYVLLNKWAVRRNHVERGEVVSLVSPTNAGQRLIKRIIAKEGDSVRTLNHKTRCVKIPEGHCWVEGDHHGHSLDSNLFGPVSLCLIQAKATRIVWPPSRWRRIEVDHSLLNSRLNPSIDHHPSDKPAAAPCVFAQDTQDTNHTELHESNCNDDNSNSVKSAQQS